MLRHNLIKNLVDTRDEKGSVERDDINKNDGETFIDVDEEYE